MNHTYDDEDFFGRYAGMPRSREGHTGGGGVAPAEASVSAS